MSTQANGWDDIIREAEATEKAAAMSDDVYAKARETLASAYKMPVELLDERRKEKLEKETEKQRADKAFLDGLKDAAGKPSVSQEAIDIYVKAQVQRLNLKFFVVEEYGGKCIVAWQEPDPLMDYRLKFEIQTFSNFNNRYIHNQIPVRLTRHGIQTEALGRVWLEHPERRQYLQVVFAPAHAPREYIDGTTGARMFNLWRGFSVKPVAGSCSVFLDHLRLIVCRGNPTLYEYLLNWMARAVQKPGERGHVAIVFKGKQGTGKSLVVDYLGEMFGSHFLPLSQGSQVTGNFNSHLRDVCILGVNEAFFAGDPRQVGPLKSLITDPTLAIEQKFVDVITVPNTLHFMVTTNEDWSIPAAVDARRFCYFEVSDEMMGDATYFNRLFEEKESGGQSALLDFLLKRDISAFEPRLFPRTEGLRRQMAQSLPPVESAWFECLMSGSLPGNTNGDGTAKMNAAVFIRWAATRNKRWVFGDEKVGNLLGKNKRSLSIDSMGFEKKRDGNGRQTWFLPSLVECRKAWNAKRFEYDWKLSADEVWEDNDYLDDHVKRPF